SSRRRHTRFSRDWSSDVCSSDLFTGSSIPAGCRFHSVSGASFGNEVSVLSAGQSPEAGLESELEGEAAGEDGEAVSTGTDGAGRSEERRAGKECSLGVMKDKGSE